MFQDIAQGWSKWSPTCAGGVFDGTFKWVERNSGAFGSMNKSEGSAWTGATDEM